MLQKEARIPKKLFPLLKKNKVYQGEFFSLRVTNNVIDQNKPKCACIISKKTIRLATDRNKLKRQVYSILYKKLVNSEKKAVIQIFPKKISTGQNYKSLEHDLFTIINTNKIL